ncbi:hypothetical protein C8T65DRAFT_26744 [Cerioporus squamosus]|nr:hypothetical protein C8T65DRAFT_26744 [Cerioporus squamosus]
MSSTITVLVRDCVDLELLVSMVQAEPRVRCPSPLLRSSDRPASSIRRPGIDFCGICAHHRIVDFATAHRTVDKHARIPLWFKLQASDYQHTCGPIWGDGPTYVHSAGHRRHAPLFLHRASPARRTGCLPQNTMHEGIVQSNGRRQRGSGFQRHARCLQDDDLRNPRRVFPSPSSCVRRALRLLLPSPIIHPSSSGCTVCMHEAQTAFRSGRCLA